MANVSDAELVARSLEDSEAFGGIFDRHASALLRYLVRRVGRTTAEGLLGDVFRIAFEARARFDCERTSALPWLYGIASNLLLKHHRTEGRRLRATARLANESQTGCAGDRVAEAAHARIILEQVAEAILQLPLGERDVLLLYAWEDQSYRDIAEALEMPVGTVRSRLNRARARLRELIEANGKEGAELEAREAPGGGRNDG